MKVSPKDEFIRMMLEIAERIRGNNAGVANANKEACVNIHTLMRGTLHLFLPACSDRNGPAYSTSEGFFTITRAILMRDDDRLSAITFGVSDGSMSDGRVLREIKFLTHFDRPEKPEFDAIVTQSQGYGEKHCRVSYNYSGVEVELIL